MPFPSALRSLAVAAASLLFVAGCGDDDSAGSDDGATVEDITENPGLDYDFDGDGVADGDQFLGEEVTVSGEVSAQINDRVFHIAGVDGTSGLLVVSEEPVVDQLEGTDVVEVTGTVREVSPSTFETEFGMPYDPDYDSFGGRHALLATSVSVEGEVEDDSDEPVNEGQGEDIAEEEDGGGSFGDEAPNEGNDGIDE